MRTYHFITWMAVVIVLLLAPLQSFSTHIIGGELYYTCLDPNNHQYRITLKLYRDCTDPSNASFDDPAYIAFYDKDSNRIDMQDVPFPGSDTLENETYKTCLFAPPTVCVEEAIYTTQKFLPPRPGGYYMVFERCCRNDDIVNINNPLSTGASWVTHIPDTSVANCNSSPRFDNFPPTIICSNAPIDLSHAATDPDGDSLVYTLCPARNSDQIVIGTSNPPADPMPKYDTVNYKAGYSSVDPLGNPADPLKIDPQTGQLTGSPGSDTGQYVVSICVHEYDKNTGEYKGMTKRDFQFNVAKCDTGLKANISYKIVDSCKNLVRFKNENDRADDFLWDFNIDNASDVDTSHHGNTANIYADTGGYRIRFIVNPNTFCADTIDTLLNIKKPALMADYLVSNVCAGDTVYFQDNSTGSKIDNWVWFFGDGNSSTQKNPAYAYKDPGIYYPQLIVKTAKGCVDTSDTSQGKVRVFGHPVVDAGDNKTIVRGESVQIGGKASGGEPQYNYQWFPFRWLSDSIEAMPVATPKRTTTYVVDVYDQNGCQAHDTIKIEVLLPAEVEVPDAFTPNGDGLNDKFYAYDVSGFNGEGITDFSMKVFDRWGEMIYESEDILEGWDGTHMKNGKEMEVGVYTWVINYKKETGESVGPLSGTVSLLR